MATVSDISVEREKRRSSNSRFEDSYCPPISRIGVDTMSLCWRDANAVDRFLRLDGTIPKDPDTRPLRVVRAPGNSARLNRRLAGLGQVGAFPSASMLYVEGRANALHRADESDHGLAKPRVLADVEVQATERLGGLLGKAPAVSQGLRRVDLAGELLFDRGEYGREFLLVLDQLHSPNHKTSPVRERGGSAIESAYWRTPKRAVPVLRAYDKGVESRTAAPGERVRLERQVRFPASKRPGVAQLLAGDLGDQFIRPIRSWIAEGLAIGDAGQLIRLLTDAAVIWPIYWSSGSCWCSSAGRVRMGLWPARKVERVLGTLAIADHYGSSWPAWSSKQRQRRMAEVRALGLLLLDIPITVDVDGLVTQLCEDWRAAA